MLCIFSFSPSLSVFQSLLFPTCLSLECLFHTGRKRRTLQVYVSMHISLSWVFHAASHSFTRKAVTSASPHLSDSLRGTQTQVTHTAMLTTLLGHWIVLRCSTQRTMPKVSTYQLPLSLMMSQSIALHRQLRLAPLQSGTLSYSVKCMDVVSHKCSFSFS